MLTRKSIGLWIVLLALLGGAGLVLGLTGGRLDDSGELREPYPPSPTRLRGSDVLPASALIGSMGCGASGCHPDITRHWESSAHHLSSFNNPFYTAAVDLLMAQEGGRTKARWCAGCHDPVLLFPGDMKGAFDPLAPEAQAGALVPPTTSDTNNNSASTFQAGETQVSMKTSNSQCPLSNGAKWVTSTSWLIAPP